MNSIAMKLNEMKNEIEIIWKDDTSIKFLSNYISPLILFVNEINDNTGEFVCNTDKILNEMLSIEAEI